MTDEEQLGERAISEAVRDVIDRVGSFEDADRRRIFRAALAFYGLDGLPSPEPHLTRPALANSAHTHQTSTVPSFSERQELSPKLFMLQKQPRTDVERVACLAYYLTHYRLTAHFKTIDISQLNTEAAQVKFSNTAYAVVNATNAGLLASAGKGFKQLSAMGERYVEALPDYNAAKEVMVNMRKQRRGRTRRNHAEPGK